MTVNPSVEKSLIAVAMSGGVDSSVAAALLVRQGYQVFGLMMRLWQPAPNRLNRCCSPADMAAARSVAGMLGIPFYTIDVQQEFKRTVVDYFVDGYAQGITPNPCMECNRTIRWQVLLHKALDLGATHLATGHYAKLGRQDGEFTLYKASDLNKDQSYVLSVLSQEQLQHALFPLAELSKDGVRQTAAEMRLPNTDKPESQDLCFVAGGDYRAFLEESGITAIPGPILDLNGKRLGSHTGLSGYTIGQRKGIGVSGPEALYVVQKDPIQNALIVGPDSALGRLVFSASHVNWISAEKPTQPFEAEVQVRYRAKLARGEIHPFPLKNRMEVRLQYPVRDVTPGQSAVIYHGDQCLGSGIIDL